MERFFMNGNNGISILVEGKQSEFKKHQNTDFIKSIDNFSTIRGNALSIAVSIENLISNNIEYIIFNEQNEGSKLFNNLFLKTPYLGFGNKRRIYKELCKLSSKTKEIYESNKSIITKIQECIEIRNKFAHGQLLYKINDEKFYLEYYSNNITQQEEIVQQKLKEDVSKFYQCINDINKLVGINGTIKKNIINE
ncbi:MAG TPA: hypothetical protein P5060_01870 [Candidatus Absconditabacterales bacterium]|nr:hypothetical protein [Candidatus Absconditabacterales bacterium]